MALLRASGRGRIWRGAARWCAVWLGVLAGPWAAGAESAAAPSGEYQLKAVFLFNFAQFAEWPARAFADARAPLVIGVLGENPFGAYLGDLVEGETVGGRPLVVAHYRRVEDVAVCHILYIGRGEAARLEPLLAQLRGRSILTIGDADNFTRAGGMVRLVNEGGKIRLRINLEAAKAGGLMISSKIVRPATIVTAGKD